MPKIVINEERCKGCELCTTVCPRGLVVIADYFNTSGYKPAMFTNEEKCTGCALCAMICPDIAIEVYK